MTSLVLVTKNAAHSGTPANPAEVNEGELRAFDLDGNLVADITAAAAGTKMYLVQGVAAGETPIKSKIFAKEDIVGSIVGETYSAATKQVSFVGFQGSGSLSIEAINSNEYTLKIVDVTKGYEPFPRATVSYTSDASATPFEIAAGLAKQIPGMTKAAADADVLVDVTSSQLQDDDGTPASVTLEVVRGSNIAYATVTAGASVDASAGDYLRIGSATAKTSPVYKTTAIEAGSGAVTVLKVTLDRPWAGASATGVAAGALSAAPALADEAGIKLTGRSAAQSFRTALEGFGSTNLATSTYPGQSVGKSGAEMQKLFLDHAGTLDYRNRVENIQEPASAVDLSANYDLYTVYLKNDNDRNVLRENETSVVFVGVKNGTGQSDDQAILGA